MAIDLTVSLNDAEQALLFEITNIENPTATSTEKREWAEATAKNGLRHELWRIKGEQVRDQQAAERVAERDEFNAQWPEVDV